MAIRFLTAGESHGKCLSAIIEGIPYGYELDFNFINSELSSRQQGHGRGGRMKIETDTIEITSGVRHSITTASPIAFTIKNRDYKNWLYAMNVEKIDFNSLDENEQKIARKQIEDKHISSFRPAHADLAAYLKYGFDDIRNSLERSSARETASKKSLRI